jgi:GNAT superfamily N-acetyltransferase
MVRRLAPGEWELLRALRLEGLEREPDAFGSTLDSSAGHDDAYWQEWAGRAVWWVAEADGVPVGIASWRIAEGSRAILIGMYVRAEARGHGLGAALVEAVCADVRAAGHARIGLGVRAGSPARRLYERCGFALTGTGYPLRDGSPLEADAMVRLL